MELQEKNVKIRKLMAEEGKVIVSKETEKDENGNDVPVIKGKVIYLAKEDSEENYVEVEEDANE